MLGFASIYQLIAAISAVTIVNGLFIIFGVYHYKEIQKLKREDKEPL